MPDTNNISKIPAYDLEKINNQLRSKYGYGPDDLRPLWRVIWSEDELEKRWMEYDDHAQPLLNPEVREVPKYQHITDRYVLERAVPVQGETDLLTKVSYEPAWSFEDRHGNYLPPRFDACEFIIETIYNQVQMGKTHKKYVDPDSEHPAESRYQKIIDMEKILFGNETATGDLMAYKEAVTDFHQKVEFTNSDNSETKQENT